jgi:hypothetical protein
LGGDDRCLASFQYTFADAAASPGRVDEERTDAGGIELRIEHVVFGRALAIASIK